MLLVNHSQARTIDLIAKLRLNPTPILVERRPWHEASTPPAPRPAPQVVKVIWTEARADNWGGFKPKFEVEFDDATGFMLTINIHYNRRQVGRRVGL